MLVRYSSCTMKLLISGRIWSAQLSGFSCFKAQCRCFSLRFFCFCYHVITVILFQDWDIILGAKASGLRFRDFGVDAHDLLHVHCNAGGAEIICVIACARISNECCDCFVPPQMYEVQLVLVLCNKPCFCCGTLQLASAAYHTYKCLDDYICRMLLSIDIAGIHLLMFSRAMMEG